MNGVGKLRSLTDEFYFRKGFKVLLRHTCDDLTGFWRKRKQEGVKLLQPQLSASTGLLCFLDQYPLWVDWNWQSL